MKFKKKPFQNVVKAAFWLNLFIPISFAAENQWQASVPNLAQAPNAWLTLIEVLQQNNLYYGTAAAAKRVLTFFSDISTKESAYKTLIYLIDQGFPIPLRDLFIPADLEPVLSTEHGDEYNFANTYYLYKAMLSQEKGIHKWAEYYFSRIDRDHFPKYIFYKALEAYEKGNLPLAQTLLLEVLNKAAEEQPLPFLKKVIRTLARVYFEQGEYEKSLDIYTSFLLKLNPISSNDWLEAAWNSFHLKKYDDALGTIYNLESKAGIQSTINLEKYNLRALIYRQTCSIPQMEELSKNFDQNFGKIIDKIKRGESLNSLPLLGNIDTPENLEYSQISQTLFNLQAELSKLSKLPRSSRNLALYLYKTEIQMQYQAIKPYSSQAYTAAATQIIMVAEQMKFLKFDIERSKFNPDTVFASSSEGGHKKSPVTLSDQGFEIRWSQFGDYWLDERNRYKGLLINRCTE